MSQEPKIRILLIDDNDVLRSGLAVFTQSVSDFELVGEGANGEEALDLCATTEPHVVLMDLKMPVMDGVTAAGLIHERFPNIRVVALTSFDDAPLIESARQAGIFGYLLKNVSIDTISDMIRGAYEARMCPC